MLNLVERKTIMNIRFGLIGLGVITSRFAKVINTVDGVEITAVASRDLSRSTAFARKFKAKTVATSYEDVINDPDVDVVYIGLTHNFHYEFTKRCLEQHKSVICEKPLVTNKKQAFELVNLAKENHTLLMEALWTRSMPAFRKAREWINGGKIGQVKLITANFNYYAPYDPNHRLFSKETDGGSLYDVGVYPIAFSTGILNEHPKSVTGSAMIAPNGVDESAAFSLQFASGALASLTCGFNTNAMDEAFIYGTTGRIVLENCFGPQYAKLFDENGMVIEDFNEPVEDGFVYQIRHCADLIRQGKIESDLIPWTDTVASAAVFDELMHLWGIR